ncbi:MAG TPA: oligosaccharide flippase family protein [Parafilimonas sp.]|nr:oligosaccharide flippase family protein [Parafilimonas sp.]
MSFKKQFFRNVFVSGGYSFLAQFVNFLSSLITARLLLPADFGLVGLITVFSNFISVFTDSGISYAIIRSNYKDTYYRGLHASSILLGSALCLLFIILIFPISFFYRNTSLVLPGIAISALFIVRAFNVVPTALLQKKLQFALAGKAIFWGASAGAISTIALAYTGFGYWSLIWSQFINAFVTALIVYKASPLKSFKIRKAVVVKSFLLARTLIGSIAGFNTITYWSRNADNLTVGKFYGTSDLGVYNRAYLMLTLPLTLITGIFSSVMYPSLIKLKNEGGNVEEEYYFMLKIISLINIPIALILIIFPQQFVFILWGKNWIQVANLLPYFGLLAMTQTLLSTLGSIMIIEKLEKSLMYTGWIGSALLVAGIIYGATISITAIAAFYALSYIILVVPFNIFYVMLYKLKYNSKIYFWLPKICLSILIWAGIYFSLPYLVYSSLLLWIFVIVWDSKNEIKKMMNLVVARRFA